jgi:hypothetical protein
VLGCGKKMEKLPFSWIVSFLRQRHMQKLPLATKQSGSKLLRHSDLQLGECLEVTPHGKSYSKKEDKEKL